jgi:hypothetical protein
MTAVQIIAGLVAGFAVGYWLPLLALAIFDEIGG